MNKQFGYDWSRLWPAVFAVPLVGAYMMWRNGDVSRPDVIILFFVGVFIVGRAACMVCNVLITKSEIHISYLLPILCRGGRFRHDDIASYAELAMDIKGRHIPIMGVPVRGSGRP